MFFFRAMLDQNLLDKQMILDLFTDLLEKTKLFDKYLKLILTIGKLACLLVCFIHKDSNILFLFFLSCSKYKSFFTI